MKKIELTAMSKTVSAALLALTLIGQAIPVSASTVNSNTKTTTLSTSKVSSAAQNTYSVKSQAELKTKIAEAIRNRFSTAVFNYNGKVNTSTFLNSVGSTVKSVINTAGDDYNKQLIDNYSISMSYYAGGVNPKIQIKFHYLETTAQSAAVTAKVNTVLKQIITTGMSQGKKVQAINSYIVKTLKYDTTLKYRSAYDGLLGAKKTVCSGYALLAYKMLTAAGLEARIVTGTANGGAHGWNLVKVDGSWYHLDTTWDDPVPDVAGRVSTAYCLLSDSQISKNHSWTRTNYPMAQKNYVNK